MDLIYLHGFSSAPNGNKGRFAREWAAAHGISFHAPDLNLPTFETLTVTAQVEAVEALVRSLPEPPVLVGSSLGGFIATAVAHRGSRLRSLILLAPGHPLRGAPHVASGLGRLSGAWGDGSLPPRRGAADAAGARAAPGPGELAGG